MTTGQRPTDTKLPHNAWRRCRASPPDERRGHRGVWGRVHRRRRRPPVAARLGPDQPGRRSGHPAHPALARDRSGRVVDRARPRRGCRLRPVRTQGRSLGPRSSLRRARPPGTRVGGALLEQAHGYGSGTTRGIIGSTPDPRAIRRYAQLRGFRLAPALSAFGVVTGSTHRQTTNVRVGTLDDLDLTMHVDRTLRGGAHGSDLVHLVDESGQLLVVDDRGYAVATPAGPAVLAALDAETAVDLLAAALRLIPSGTAVEFG